MKESFNNASKQCEIYEMPLPVIKTIQERDELVKIAEGPLLDQRRMEG